jgi:hypothetical protein
MKKIKIKKEIKDEKAIRKAKEISYAHKTEKIKLKNDYITNTINGRYFLARCNMIAEQIQTNNIKENIDGCPKSKDYMLAEHAFIKKTALSCYRDAHFAKQNLVDSHNFKEGDFEAMLIDVYDGKVIREDYDDEYKKYNRAEFVKSEE